MSHWSHGVTPSYLDGQEFFKIANIFIFPTFLVATIIFLLVFFTIPRDYKVTLYGGKHPLVDRLIRNSPSLKRPYRPPSWAEGAWTQSIVYMIRGIINENRLQGFYRQIVELPDGEQVTLTWVYPDHIEKNFLYESSTYEKEQSKKFQTTNEKKQKLSEKICQNQENGIISDDEEFKENVDRKIPFFPNESLTNKRQILQNNKERHQIPMTLGYAGALNNLFDEHSNNKEPDFYDDEQEKVPSVTERHQSYEYLDKNLFSLPENMPIIIFCHGVFQTVGDLRDFCRHMSKQCGYVSVVFNRRGNDIPLSRPKFNTVGDQDDFVTVLSLLKKTYPKNKIFGVGISAGSSLLARYLGDAGYGSLIDAALLVSPGYDMELSLQQMHPMADKLITTCAKVHFLEKNKSALERSDSEINLQEGYHKLKKSTSMQEFHEHMHVFDGTESKEEYYKKHNPIYVLDKVQRPIVYLSANDDPCFPGAFTFQYKYLVHRCSSTIIMQLEKGGHATFYEKWDASSSRAFRIVDDMIKVFKEVDPEQEYPPSPQKSSRMLCVPHEICNNKNVSNIFLEKSNPNSESPTSTIPFTLRKLSMENMEERYTSSTNSPNRLAKDLPFSVFKRIPSGETFPLGSSVHSYTESITESEEEQVMF